MKETSARLLRLLSLLQRQQDWSGQALADRLEVSTRTVRRDVDKLRELDYPIHAVTGIAGGYRLGAGARLPPLLLDDDEAVAVAIALRTATSNASASSVAGVGETALSALIKLEQVLPQRLRTRVSSIQVSAVPAPGRVPTVDPDILSAVGAARRDRRRLRFGYRNHGGAETTRDVEPHELVIWGPRWYLVAWDVEREDWRTFRVDRISPSPLSGRAFSAREIPGGAAARVTSGVASAWPFRATILLHAPAESDAVRELTDYGKVEPFGRTQSLLHAGSDNASALAFFLGGVDVDFEVLDSPELADRLRVMAERFTKAAGARR